MPMMLRRWRSGLAMRRRALSQIADHAWRKGLSGVGSQPVSIAFLGVFDTVGALGLPIGFSSGSLARVVNRRHGFHDLRLDHR